MIVFSHETWPFGAAMLLLLALLVMEGVGLLFAGSPAGWLDGLLPDSGDGPLGWLHIGKVPFLILLGIFLAGFSIGGYVIQGVCAALFGTLLPAWMASLPALLTGSAAVIGLGGLIARIMPSDESSAVSEQSLIGRAGVVVQGVARKGMAAQAKVKDLHGRAHYVLVEPDLHSEVFEEGAVVLLVKKSGARYFGIRNPHPDLL